MKHIVIVIDGTWVSAADPDTPFSNAYNLNWLLDNRAQDGAAQIVFYSSGIGTDRTASPYFSGATGRGIDAQTREAYINLCSNFKKSDEEGRSDKVYLFGFSRGAIVARALSAMISNFGLLRPSHMRHFPDLWKRFIAGDKLTSKQWRNVVHRDIDIELVGLFDCVFGSRNHSGRFHELRFRDYKVADTVKAAVHLMSLDDSRTAFAPMLWLPNETTLLEQIWMPGVHSDIGGTYADQRLGRVALITMMDRIAAHTDLRFEPDSEKRAQALFGQLKINNEREGLGRFWRYGSRHRVYTANQRQFLHPLVRELDEHEISYKGFRGRYPLHPTFVKPQCPVFDDFKFTHDWSSYAFG